jgi:GIY-YIG catalytic domain-containing protein
MRENALVSWHECPEPWLVESTLCASLDLPLNLDQNSHGAFHAH